MLWIRSVTMAGAWIVVAFGSAARGQQQPAPAQSPLAQYPGFGHDHAADRARYRRQEVAREQAIAQCMQRAGFRYTPAPSEVNRRAANAKEALATRQNPNERYVASLSPEARTRYNLALYGVPDPNDEANLWDPKSPTGGGCWGEVMRDRPSVYAAQNELNEPYLRMLRSVTEDPRLRAAEQRWAECMAARGFTYANPRALESETDRAAVQGPPAGRSMADVQQRNQQARTAARECNAAAGLDSALESVRVEKETEFVNAHRPVLDRHRERQRTQVLPPV